MQDDAGMRWRGAEKKEKRPRRTETKPKANAHDADSSAMRTLSVKPKGRGEPAEGRSPEQNQELRIGAVCANPPNVRKSDGARLAA